MSLHSVVAVASGGADDAVVLSVAANAAARDGGLVRVVPAFPDPAADYVSLGAALGQADAAIEERLAAGAAQEKLETLARDIAMELGQSNAPAQGAAIEVERRRLLPALAVARASVLADLVVFGGEAARGVLRGIFAETLIAMRAPCLVANGPIGFGMAAVAWDGSAQAGRAVRAALPLLAAASAILVIRNADDPDLDVEASSPQRLIDYLERHGAAQATTIDVSGERVADSILAAALAQHCDLVVAGAYGRARLVEMFLGGATRGFVSAKRAPNLLLAH